MFGISLFVCAWIAPVEAESTLETYGTFVNSFQPRIKRYIRRFEQIKDRICRQTDTHTHTHIHTRYHPSYTITFLRHTYIYIYIYIYIHTYRLSSRFWMWPPIEFCNSFLYPPLFFSGCMHPQMTFQACQIATNFTTDWALSVALAHMNVKIRSRKLDMFAHIAFKTRKWVTGFYSYFTVDVVNLLTGRLSLLALNNWSFISGILNTTILKGFNARMKLFAPLTSIQCRSYINTYVQRKV